MLRTLHYYALAINVVVINVVVINVALLCCGHQCWLLASSPSQAANYIHTASCLLAAIA
jgi:hypothetical protein